MSAQQPPPGPDGSEPAPAGPPSEEILATSDGRSGGLAVKVVAVVLIVALVATGGALAFVTLTGGTSRDLRLTDQAGGMQRDTATEGEIADDLRAAEREFVSEAGGDEGNLEYTRVGVYEQTDQDAGPVGSVAFIGAKTSQQQDPRVFIDGVVENAENNGFDTQPVATEDDAVAVCASQETVDLITICAWATDDTVGQLIPLTPGWTADQLGALLLDVRADVETSD